MKWSIIVILYSDILRHVPCTWDCFTLCCVEIFGTVAQPGEDILV
jgi:hypothetical protein